MTMSDRDNAAYKAKLAECAERYEEVVAAMKVIAKMGVELTTVERYRLSDAYKNMIRARRSSWRIIVAIQQMHELKGEFNRLHLVKAYRTQVEKELRDICNDVVDLLDNTIIPCSKTSELTVFYHKMKGDYYRYLAEFVEGDDRKEVAENAMFAYKMGTDIAENDLPATNPMRLALAMNFSVYYYSTLKSMDRACAHLRGARDAAIKDLDTLTKATYKDSTHILQMMRDTLTFWMTLAENDGIRTGHELNLNVPNVRKSS